MTEQAQGGRNRRAVLGIAAAGGFLAFLDTTIVNTSFPDIAASFDGASRSELSWILDAYFIVIAALLVPAGLLADRIGRKRAFLGGVALFALTSGLCAIAPTWETLVAARVLQGVGAAVIAPVSLALVLPEYPREERATAVGIWGAAAALAAACGPPLGGLLVEVADWRWIFLVNLPVSVLLLVAGRRVLRESRDEHATGTPDLVGAAVAVLGLGALALAIVEGRSWGWGSTASVLAFGSAALLLGVVVARCASHPVPVVDPALLRIRSFRLGSIGTLLVATAFFATILGNVLFLTEIWGYSVLDAGLAVVPGPVATAIVSGPAGRLADRFGHRAVILPGILVWLGALLVFRSTGPSPDYLGTWLPAMVLNGVAIGLVFPTFGAAAVSDVPADRFGSASAVSGAFRQFGAVIGTAVLVAVVGDPDPAAALGAAHRGYLVGVVAVLLAGAVAALLRREPVTVALQPAGSTANAITA